MTKVWVVTVGDSESFNSVWITHQLAWLHAQKIARDHKHGYPKTRFKYPPDKGYLTLQGRNTYDTLDGKWRSLLVIYVEEAEVQGDVVQALAEVSADDA